VSTKYSLMLEDALRLRGGSVVDKRHSKGGKGGISTGLCTKVWPTADQYCSTCRSNQRRVSKVTTVGLLDDLGTASQMMPMSVTSKLQAAFSFGDCTSYVTANHIVQNLVSLLLRPLRLFLPAEKLRSLRIILLKATHWPFVGLILAWENGRLYLNQRRNVNSSSQSLRGPNSPTGVRRSVAGGWWHGSSKTRPPQLGQAPRTGRRPMARPEPAATETIDDLQAAVAALKTQVEAIASLLEKTSTPSIA
jgi:hypothetical protein